MQADSLPSEPPGKPRKDVFPKKIYKRPLAHVKICANYQGNANQNSNELPPNTHQDGYSKKNQKVTSAGKDVEKEEALYAVGGNVKWYNCCGKQYG